MMLMEADSKIYMLNTRIMNVPYVKNDLFSVTRVGRWLMVSYS